MVEHTKGPWVQSFKKGLGAAVISSERCSHIATVYSLKDAALIEAAPRMLEALRRADQFITNGIELGFIRMPDADTPDTAHETPGIVRAAIAAATKGQS